MKAPTTVLDVVLFYLEYVFKHAWLEIVLGLVGAAVIATAAYFIFRKYNIGEYAAIITFISGAIGMLSALALKAAMDKNPKMERIFIILIIAWITLFLYPLISMIIAFITESVWIASFTIVAISFMINIAFLIYAGEKVFEFKKEDKKVEENK
ncbi:MAG: hypothetical protein QXW13_00090 [Nanopusillaceae archaeon]